jgi:hypothetical protein
MIGLVADLIRGNRRLIEDTQYRVRKLEIGRFYKEKELDKKGEKSEN